MRKEFCAAFAATSVVFAFTGVDAHAATHIDVGTNNLLPNTANQVITLQVTNDVGTTPPEVTDFAGYFQIGPNTLDQVVPVFQGADFTNTFWGPGSAGGVGPEPGLPQLMQKGFSLDAGSVAASRNLINLVVDTTGIASGSFALKLTNNAYTDVFGQNSSFLPSAANSAITINNGSITIAAGPTNYYWDVNGTTAGAGGATPAGNWDGATANFNSDSSGGAGGSLSATPAAADTVTFAAGSDATGAYAVTVSGTRSAALVKFEEGNMTLAGGTLAVGAFDVAAGTTANVSSAVAGGVSGSLTKTGAGTLTLAAANSHAGGTTVSAGTLVLANADAAAGGAIDIANGALVQAQGALPKALTVTTLATHASGKFDMADNSMVIKGMTTAQVRSLIVGAFNAGHWNGATGLDSSTAAANASGTTAIGYGTAGALNKTSFKGVDGLTATDVLVKYTYYGDADLNGATTLDDFTLFLGGYQNGGSTWTQGDFDYSGQTTLDDFTLLLKGYQQQGAQLSEIEALINTIPMSDTERAAMLASIQAVPEPTIGAIGGLIGLSFAARRRNVRRALKY